MSVHLHLFICMRRDRRFSLRKWSVDFDKRVLGRMTLALVASIDSLFLHGVDVEIQTCDRNWVENPKTVQDLILSE